LSESLRKKCLQKNRQTLETTKLKKKRKKEKEKSPDTNIENSG
jgi:hypothetical protein